MAATSSTGATAVTLSVEEAVDNLLACSELPAVETGFPNLDEVLGGGFQSGQVAVVCAGTGVGKTAFALQIADHVAASTPVLFATYELPARSLVARLVSQQIPDTQWLDVIRGSISREEMLAVLPTKLRFAEYPPLEKLRQAAEEISEKYQQAPFIIIDYMQLVGRVVAEGSGQADPRTANEGASEYIRNLANQLNSPVLVISSVSRASNNKLRNARSASPGDLVDVAKESGSIEYDAGAVLVLSTNANSTTERTLTIAKNRFGETAHLNYSFEGASGRWAEIAKVTQDRNEGMRQEIIASLKNANAPLTKNAIISREDKKWVTGRKKDVLTTITELASDGILVKSNEKYSIAEVER